MLEEYYLYLLALKSVIPDYVFYTLLIVLLSSLLMCFISSLRRLYIRLICRILLIEYVFLIYSSTLIFRTSDDAYYHNFTPFWSYSRSLRRGCLIMSVDMVMNVAIFFPVGFLIGLAFHTVKWWHTMIIGGGISLSIEIMQYLTNRGVSELDDVFHNALGCFVGFCAFRLLSLLWNQHIIWYQKLCMKENK